MDGVTAPSGVSQGVNDVTIDAMRGQVLVATEQGLLRADDPGGAASIKLEPVGGLTRARCVAVLDSAIYVCSSQVPPDSAALARSDDGGKTFRSVLSYAETAGPVECPPDTPMGQQCPGIWETYKSQLGVGIGAVDGGGDGVSWGKDSAKWCPSLSKVRPMTLALSVANIRFQT
jgi:hypothetical protein